MPLNDDFFDDDSDCDYYEDDEEEGDAYFEPATFRGRAHYAEITSTRMFGVEIETHSCFDYTRIPTTAWGAKYDGSIDGKEFYSSILYGDDGLTAIRDICAFAKDHNWSVNASCGLHVHFDLRNETEDQLKAIALAYIWTYDVWKLFVSPSRLGNCFCLPNRTHAMEIFCANNWHRFSSSQTRYEWANFNAYWAHRTLELRIHQGTLNADKIINWIEAHVAFIDWASNAGWTKVRNTLLCMTVEEKLHFMHDVWRKAGYAHLPEYYNNMVRELCNA